MPAGERGACSILNNLFRHFRSERMRLFERTFAMTAETRVLDVGGSPLIWQFAKVRPKLTFLNLPPAIEQRVADGDFVGGDGRVLPFRDRAFDIVFSNSTIEHVGTRADQQRFATEIMRVGKQYWVQTPNRWFPFELHTMVPLVHFLPGRWQRRVLMRFTGWELMVPHTADQRRDYLEHVLTEMRLLNAAELREMFPEGRILRERVLGMTKSLIACKAH